MIKKQSAIENFIFSPKSLRYSDVKYVLQDEPCDVWQTKQTLTERRISVRVFIWKMAFRYALSLSPRKLDKSFCKAHFRRRTFHVANRMQMNLNKDFSS